MASLGIRVYGDPVLATPAREVTEIDGSVKKLVDYMFSTLAASPRGIGLAANQVGVLAKVFVYDVPDLGRRGAVINPRIVESEGEWEYREGCLSVPGLSFDIKRANRVLLKGLDIDGNEIEMEGEELLGRLFQHEVDHLEGRLLLSRLTPEVLKEASDHLLALVEHFGMRLPVSVAMG